MLEVEPTDQSGRNGNEAVVGAILEAFARCCTIDMPIEQPSAEGISFRLVQF